MGSGRSGLGRNAGGVKLSAAEMKELQNKAIRQAHREVLKMDQWLFLQGAMDHNMTMDEWETYLEKQLSEQKLKELVKEAQELKSGARPIEIDTSKYRVISHQEQMRLKQNLNQDGKRESIYVGTSNSFSVNAYWRQAAGGQQSGWVSLPESTIHDITRQLDSWMKPLPYSLQGTRLVDTDWVRDNFGTDSLKTVAAIINKDHPTITDNGFFSFSTDVKRNVFTGRDVYLHTYVEKGTKVFVTSNYRESEIIGHRGTESYFTKAWVDKQGKLHIDCITK